MPTAVGFALIGAWRGGRWLAEARYRARFQALPPEPIERLEADLRRLRAELEDPETRSSLNAQDPPGAARTRRLPGHAGNGLPAAGYRPASRWRPRLAGRDLPGGSGAAARWPRGPHAGTGNGRALREPRGVL